MFHYSWLSTRRPVTPGIAPGTEPAITIPLRIEIDDAGVGTIVERFNDGTVLGRLSTVGWWVIAVG